MENPILDFSATLAKPALVRVDDALRAHMAAAFEVHARLDAELRARPAPGPVPRRQRKRSLAKVCEAARKAGADRVIVDGVVIALSPAASVPEGDLLALSWASYDGTHIRLKQSKTGARMIIPVGVPLKAALARCGSDEDGASAPFAPPRAARSRLQARALLRLCQAAPQVGPPQQDDDATLKAL